MVLAFWGWGFDSISIFSFFLVQIFFPALLQHRWVCYAWDTEHSNITVFDPWLSPELVDDLEEVHCQVVCAIKRAMLDVSNHLFEGCNYQWEYESVVLLRMDSTTPSRCVLSFRWGRWWVGVFLLCFWTVCVFTYFSFLRLFRFFVPLNSVNRSGFLCVQFCFCYRGCDGGTEHYIVSKYVVLELVMQLYVFFLFESSVVFFFAGIFRLIMCGNLLHV